jgi:hypothetical protein
MTFARRAIDVTFRLGTGTFGDSGFDTVKLSGLRCSASITSGDSATSAELQLRVWGMDPTVMRQLTLLNQGYAQRIGKRVNYVTVEAGDKGGAMTTVFTGGIIEAWADFGAIPDTSFVLTATAGLIDRYKPAGSVFFAEADASLIMQDIAARMQRRFENNGVDGIIIRNVHLSGSLFDQMQDVRRQAAINAVIDEKNGNLVIWPRDQARRAAIPLVSAATGMRGYPAFTQYGVRVDTLYNPGIASGGQVALESSILPATGRWYVYLVGHDLEAEMPEGKWFTHFEASISQEARPLG